MGGAAFWAGRSRKLGATTGHLAGAAVTHSDSFIQKAVGWWLRSLSAHDPDLVRAFLAGPGAGAPFRSEALRRL